MLREWSPNIQHKMLSGPSATKLALWVFISACAGILSALLLVGGMAVRGDGYSGSTVLTSLMGMLGVSAIVATVSNLMLHYWAVRREVRAGYITGHRLHREVDYVDTKTGRVIRLAGEDFLDPEERRRRVRLIREAVATETSDGDGSGS